MNAAEYKEWFNTLTDEEKVSLKAKKRKVHRKRANAKRTATRNKKANNTATETVVYVKNKPAVPKGCKDYKPTVKDQSIREKCHVPASEYQPTAYVADTRSKPNAVRIDRVNLNRIDERAARKLERSEGKKAKRLARMAARTKRKLAA